MEETLDYIDRYFRGELLAEERLSFEGRCEADEEFAGIVAFYVSTRQILRDELEEKRKAEFQELYHTLSRTSVSRPSPVRKLMPYISVAAACLLLFVGWWAFFRVSGPRALAEGYIGRHFSALPVTMSGSRDSLQSGLDAYNKRDYDQAEALFSALIRKDGRNIEARKYLGILWLVKGDCDKALVQFDSLAVRQDLYSNPGPFYKAITLMKRSAGDDRREAKRLLQEVVDKKLPGNEQAEKWIREL
jgi:tetratricopeptide (TPR) repeat protein